MTAAFKRHELPLAYTMVETVRRIKPRRDGGHTYQHYFLYWTAFNNIYTTIANRAGYRTLIKKNEDGTIITTANGHVNIPEVEIVTEKEQIHLALKEFDENLKHALILHDGTQHFVGRIPCWGGTRIETDAFGQRVNGVIHVQHTSSSQYPVWSPIDIQYYQEYLQNPDNQEIRDFLARQIVDLLFTVRENFMQGGKKLDDANDLSVVENALPMLEFIVKSFLY
ncbi:MAG: hypothetical protein ACK2U1_14325 [Anaerolineales bacterium]